MKKPFTLIYRGLYQFTFSFEYLGSQIPVKHPNRECPWLTVSLFRHDRPGFTWDWSECLIPDDRIEFHLLFEDGISIKGSFHLFQSLRTGEEFVFLDAWFGEVYEEHFEGNVFELGKIRPVPPIPVPVPVVDVTPDPLPGNELIRAAGFQDLFPYLYLQYWPALSAADEPLFIQYSGGRYSPPSSSDFYTRLLSLRTDTDARTEMEKEALLFINEGPPYAGCFISEPGNLIFPFNVYPEIYDILYRYDAPSDWESLLQLLRNFIADWEDIDQLIPTPIYQLQLDRIWQNVMALNIIAGYGAYVLEQLIKMLVIDHLLAEVRIPSEENCGQWKRLIRASVVLPPGVFPLPAFAPEGLGGLQKPGLQKPPLYSGVIVPYAIGDLQKVQHCHTGYEPGEIAQIENVFTGEIKKVKNRHKHLFEETTEYGNRKQVGNDRYSTGEQLEKAVIRALNQTISNELDFTNLTTSYGPPTTGTYNGKVKDTKTITDLDNTGSTHFAKKILAEAVQRISQEVYDHRKSSSKRETEDVVIRTIDNRQGGRNIRGIYRWLNKVYKMRLVNYGRRFILEFLIQKPSLTRTDGDRNGVELPLLPPDKLAEPVHSFRDITADNFVHLGAYYQVSDLPLPPVGARVVTAMLTDETFFPADGIRVPEGYIPDSVTVTYNLSQPALLIVGVKQVDLDATASVITITDPLGIACEVDALPILLDIAVASPPARTTFYLSIAVHCSLSEEAFNAWQLKVYNLIRNAYDRQQRRYDHREAEGQGPFNRQVENRAIRRTVLEACQSVLYQLYEKNNGIIQPSASPPQELVDKPAYLQFFGEAFEWHEMSCSMEDEPVASRKEDLLEKLDEAWSNQPMTSFIRARRLRVLVPVKSSYAFRVLYYLSAGLLMYGKDHLTAVFENDRVIAASLKQLGEVPGREPVTELDSWRLTVPTQMQWLQDDDRLPAFNT
ncbi:MAG: hypothetical protein JST68_30840 [Bacteroidetes bacterium]|nr:hypothetical protein [Bacteroidota bacterium]